MLDFGRSLLEIALYRVDFSISIALLVISTFVVKNSYEYGRFGYLGYILVLCYWLYSLGIIKFLFKSISIEIIATFTIIPICFILIRSYNDLAQNIGKFGSIIVSLYWLYEAINFSIWLFHSIKKAISSNIEVIFVSGTIIILIAFIGMLVFLKLRRVTPIEKVDISVPSSESNSSYSRNAQDTTFNKNLYYVYIFVDEIFGRVKIGISNNPHTRLSQVQRNSPNPLKLVDTIQVDHKEKAEQIEKKAHRALTKHWIDGEWFKVPVNLAVDVLHSLVENSQEPLEEILNKSHQDKPDSNHQKKTPPANPRKHRIWRR